MKDGKVSQKIEELNDFDEESTETSPTDENILGSRAKNQTVMLTPEITDKVRAMLGSSKSEDDNQDSGLSEFLAHSSWSKPGEAQALPSESQEQAQQEHEQAFEDDSSLSDFNLGEYDEPESSFTDGIFNVTPGVQEAKEESDIVLKDADELSQEEEIEVLSKKSEIVSPALADGYSIISDDLGSQIKDDNKKEETKMDHVAQPSVAYSEDINKRVPAAQIDTLHNPDCSVWTSKQDKPTKIIAVLISFDKVDTGEVVALREGRWIISPSASKDKGSLYLVIDDSSVSSMHGVVRVKESAIHISDNLSEYGTAITRAGSDKEEEVTSASEIKSGDKLRIGEREFKVAIF